MLLGFGVEALLAEGSRLAFRRSAACQVVIQSISE